MCLFAICISFPMKCLSMSFFHFVQFSCSVVSNCLQPMDCVMPGFPVYHTLLELTQTHVLCHVGDLIQPAHPLLPPSIFNLPLSIFPSIRVFSKESVLSIRWPKYWSFSFSISPSNEYSGLISFRMDWLDFLAVQVSNVFSNTTTQF